MVEAAGVGAAVPKAVPKEKPPVFAAGALRKTHNHRSSKNKSINLNIGKDVSMLQ